MLTISVAASTRDLMQELVKEFAKISDVDIRINSGPTSGLANQIIAGAPIDMFLAASEQWANEVERSVGAFERVDLLSNKLVMIVPAKNPGEVHTPTDLLKPQVHRIALAGENVPAGMYADQALQKLDLSKSLHDEAKIVRGQDVRSALEYVERGEVEAGIVYATDVMAAASVQVVYEFESSLHDRIVYVLMRLKNTEGKESTKTFMEFLQGETAKLIYRRFQFSPLL